jgi:hypothetical protein
MHVLGCGELIPSGHMAAWPNHANMHRWVQCTACCHIVAAAHGLCWGNISMYFNSLFETAEITLQGVGHQGAAKAKFGSAHPAS